MTWALFFEAWGKFLLGVAAMGGLLFIPAGSLGYWNGWLFMAVLFIPMLVGGVVLMIKNPGLLQKRLRAKERQAEQCLVIKLSGLLFCGGFILAGLNDRFQWTALPTPAVVIGVVLFLLSYLLYAEVLRENAYLFRTIEVQQGQKVIDTGLYGLVRHPMYSVTLVMFLSMPLVLGSLPSLVLFLFYPALLVKRLRSEERLLEAELKGYRAYKKKVKYRLIPFLW